MLKVREDYVKEFCVVFNASKCKFVVSARGCKYRLQICNRDVVFTISTAIEVVDSWNHLGHVISSNMDDSLPATLTEAIRVHG